MRWGKHLMTARNDEKMVLLRETHGAEGYGIYWMIFEMIGEKATGSCTKVSFPESFWRKNLGVSAKKFRVFADFFKNYGLFLVEKCGNVVTFDCPNILKYCDEYTERQVKKSGQNRDTVGSLSDPRARVNPEIEEEREIEEEEEETPLTPLAGGVEWGEADPLPIMNDGLPKMPTGLCESIRDAYDRILVPVGWHQFGLWYDKLVRQVRTCIGEKPARAGPEFWEGLFNRIRGSDFINGPKFNCRSIDWVTKPETVGKIENGMWQANETKQQGSKKERNIKALQEWTPPRGNHEAD